MRKPIARIAGLAAVLALVGLASAHSVTFGTCTYRCHNTTTGQTTIVTSGASEAACCGGTVTCPTGSTYVGTLSYNGGHGPTRCTA